MSRHYLSLTPSEHARLKAAAVKYGQPMHKLAVRAVMREVERIEGIPEKPPKHVQDVLDQRSAEQELFAVLEDLGATIDKE